MKVTRLNQYNVKRDGIVHYKFFLNWNGLQDREKQDKCREFKNAGGGLYDTAVLDTVKGDKKMWQSRYCQ